MTTYRLHFEPISDHSSVFIRENDSLNFSMVQTESIVLYRYKMCPVQVLYCTPVQFNGQVPVLYPGTIILYLFTLWLQLTRQIIPLSSTNQV